MIRRPPRSTQSRSSAASDVYKRQVFATPYSFETVLVRMREAIALREEIRILKEQERILSDGFRKTSQRINLYEQRLIPDCREALRKIAVYLQDQQAAAVGVAKTAKRLSEEN